MLARPLSLLLLLPGLALPAAGLEVVLLRHADKDTTRGDYNLSPEGLQRALRLGRLIPACLGPPTQIISYELNPETSKNARSYQSAVPLAVATGVNIRIARNSAESSYQIGQQLRQRAGASGERLVLFWEHRRLPELARGLGWDGLSPIAEDDFDQLILLSLATPTSAPVVRRHLQSAMARWPCASSASPGRERDPRPPSPVPCP